MKTKALWRISITTTPEAEDAVAEMLGAVLGRAAVTYFNVETGVSTVTVYCEARPAADARKTMAAGLGQIKKFGLIAGPGKITIAKVRREDWAESWKRHFKPIEIRFRRVEFHESPNKMKLAARGTRLSGKSLLIKPGWFKRKPRKNQAVVVLDPGLSFGTGQHPTTVFCLHQIVAAVSDRRNRRSATAKSFWTSAPVPAFWQLRRQNSAANRFTHLTLTQMRSRLPV